MPTPAHQVRLGLPDCRLTLTSRHTDLIITAFLTPVLTPSPTPTSLPRLRSTKIASMASIGLLALVGGGGHGHGSVAAGHIGASGHGAGGGLDPCARWACHVSQVRGDGRPEGDLIQNPQMTRPCVIHFRLIRDCAFFTGARRAAGQESQARSYRDHGASYLKQPR